MVEKYNRTTCADLVDALFRQRQHPTRGREFSYAEVSRAVDGGVTPSHLAKVRAGAIRNPGRESLLYLCVFFGVPPSYFFPELDDADEVPEERVVPLVNRIQSLTPSQQALISIIVNTLLDTASDTCDPHRSIGS